MTNDELRNVKKLLGIAGAILVASLIFFMVAMPWYRVWSWHMQGSAKLAQAEQEKRIMIEQAKAEVESARLRAEAIALVGKAAKDYPEYRTQEFIGAFAEALREGNVDQIIYVPTEANIPILEARPRTP